MSLPFSRAVYEQFICASTSSYLLPYHKHQRLQTIGGRRGGGKRNRTPPLSQLKKIRNELTPSPKNIQRQRDEPPSDSDSLSAESYASSDSTSEFSGIEAHQTSHSKNLLLTNPLSTPSHSNKKLRFHHQLLYRTLMASSCSTCISGLNHLYYWSFRKIFIL